MFKEWVFLKEIRDALRKQNQLLELIAQHFVGDAFYSLDSDFDEDDSVVYDTDDEQQAIDELKTVLRERGYDFEQVAKDFGLYE